MTPEPGKPSLKERLTILAIRMGELDHPTDREGCEAEARAIAAELGEIAALQHSYCDHYDPLAPHAFIDMIRKWADRLARREP